MMGSRCSPKGWPRDDVYDWVVAAGGTDGDWPPMPTALALSAFEDHDEAAWAELLNDDVGAEVVTTIYTGDYLEIPSENERQLLASFDRLGIQYVRDDALIESLSLPY